jgi:hypothetical protein
MAPRAPKKPLLPQPIKTDRLPAICPACASKNLGKVENFGIWRVACQRCAWREYYQVTARA